MFTIHVCELLSHPHQHLVWLIFYILVILIDISYYLMIWIWISLVLMMLNMFLGCYLPPGYFLWWSVYFRVFFSFRVFFYIVNTSYLSDICFATFFIKAVAVIFIFITLAFFFLNWCFYFIFFCLILILFC